MASILELKHEQKEGNLSSCSWEALRVTLVSAVLMAFPAEPLQEAFACSHTVSCPCSGDHIIVKRNEEKVPFWIPKWDLQHSSQGQAGDSSLAISMLCKPKRIRRSFPTKSSCAVLAISALTDAMCLSRVHSELYFQMVVLWMLHFRLLRKFCLDVAHFWLVNVF